MAKRKSESRTQSVASSANPDTLLLPVPSLAVRLETDLAAIPLQRIVQGIAEAWYEGMGNDAEDRLKTVIGRELAALVREGKLSPCAQCHFISGVLDDDDGCPAWDEAEREAAGFDDEPWGQLYQALRFRAGDGQPEPAANAG